MRPALPLLITIAAAPLGSIGGACAACGRTTPIWLCGRCRRLAEASWTVRREAPSVSPSEPEFFALAPYTPTHARKGAENPLRDALIRFKYGGDRMTGHRLAALMGTTSATLRGRFDAVTAVPLHPARLRMRGFNQAGWFARAVASHIGVPTAPRLLIRTGASVAQTVRGGRSARLALVNPFALGRDGRRSRIPRRVLLVDDVRTTGATLDACTQVLCRRGVSISVLVMLSAHLRPDN